MTHYFASDDEIEAHGLGLLDRTLPKANWTHAGHFCAALWLLRARPDIDAARQMPGSLRPIPDPVHLLFQGTGRAAAVNCSAGLPLGEQPRADHGHVVIVERFADQLADQPAAEPVDSPAALLGG